MDACADHQRAAVQIMRDKRGIVVGRFEAQRNTGKTITRNARGILVGQYDHRANVTRDARGVLVGTDNLLPVLVLPR